MRSAALYIASSCDVLYSKLPEKKKKKKLRCLFFCECLDMFLSAILLGFSFFVPFGSSFVQRRWMNKKIN